MLIAVSKCLHSRRLQCFESHCEDLWVSVQVHAASGKPDELTLCAVYLPPPIQKHILNDFINNTNRVLDGHNVQNIAFIGDFNLSSITWRFNNENCPLDGEVNNSTYATTLLDFTAIYDLKQYNYIPNVKCKQLDLLLTNVRVTDLLENKSPLSIIDPLHPPLQFSISLSPSIHLPANNNVRLCFHKANYEKIISELNKVCWEEEFADCKSVTNLY